VTGAQQLLLGEATYVLAGGMENMSQAPHVVRGARFGLALGQQTKFEDTLWRASPTRLTAVPMAITAENLARKYSISRVASDEFSLRSQAGAAAAIKSGFFAERDRAGRDARAQRTGRHLSR